MKDNVFLNTNNKDALDKLKELGYHICVCCEFKNSKWLHFYYRESDDKKEFHGIGYACENECKDNNSEMCIKCCLKECFDHNEDVHIFSNIENMDNYIKNIWKK